MGVWGLEGGLGGLRSGEFWAGVGGYQAWWPDGGMGFGDCGDLGGACGYRARGLGARKPERGREISAFG